MRENSKVERETLISSKEGNTFKSSGLAFAIGCFKLASGLCRDIEMIIMQFWWGQKGDRWKIHWKNWETLCQPKVEGGMGFKELSKFTDAMLAK